MKKYILILLTSVVTLSSCSDWFDVTSGSEIREKDHYSTLAGFQQSLIGCYISMTDNALYGKELSWYAIEILGHQFNPVTSNSSNSREMQEYEKFNYDHTQIFSDIENIWAKAYSVIANANEALTNMEGQESSLNEVYYHVIKGELLAIRAYIHFDLLRLYGYGDWKNRSAELNSKKTIPYVTTLSSIPTPQRTGKETLQMIINDLEAAEKLLKEYDPITKKHPASYYTSIDADGFFKDRTLRLNYYAVKALEARVYLWEGSKESIDKALNATEEIITAIGDNGIVMYDMYTYSYLLPEISQSNRSLASEALFSLNVSDITSKITSYIIPNFVNTDYTAMYISPTDVENIYEGINSDVRFTRMLDQTQSDSRGYVPMKIHQASLDEFNKNRLSLIRLPEIFYIAAECYATSATPNLDMALQRLNKIRENRGISTPLENLNADQIIKEIQKEYHKEFISEGVMFYYYKRTGCKSIPNYSEEMTDTQYLLPYPTFEIQSGRVQ